MDPSPKNTPAGTVDWEKTLETLLKIQEINPGFIEDNALIGGTAAWFYRTLLEKEQDKDFPCPPYTAAEEKLWLSKDIDFMGTKRRDYPKELQIEATGEPPKVKIDGVWVDTPDEGVYLTRTGVLKTAVEIENPESGHSFKVASPTQLYREKKALLAGGRTKKRPQDPLHLRVLKTAAKLLLCKLAENNTLNQKQGSLLFKLLKEAQEIAPEILQDPKLLSRLARQIPKLGANPKTKAVHHLLKQQVFGGGDKGPIME